MATEAQALVDSVKKYSQTMTATRSGTQITLRAAASAGANGNRIGVYANVQGAGTESWRPAWQTMSGGTSPTRWRISLDFGSLTDIHGDTVPTNAVRKLRWTYAANLQACAF